MISYLKVVWHHEFDDEPVFLFSEIEDGWEIRKVEKFRDGRSQYAGPEGSTGDTMLSETPMPSPAEIAEDPQFTLETIDTEDFDLEWRGAGGG
ncbi:DUF6881 domain-containing protein [Microbacterium kyungheense]|uniref:DUF6881 domain-containing protein n=1 Tax=Microbacterium kyungheense TaxID=1263636 RepID=A0A543FIR7_9MICO|nr:hypothetical protein [Microbacterium kyungheense]TQM33749.1 hypothetical protein FB391_0032 [Microbacterium kyungheense]